MRLWSHFQRGYRPEADPIWVARAAASELNVDNNDTNDGTSNGTDPKVRRYTNSRGSRVMFPQRQSISEAVTGVQPLTFLGIMLTLTCSSAPL